MPVPFYISYTFFPCRLCKIHCLSLSRIFNYILYQVQNNCRIKKIINQSQQNRREFLNLYRRMHTHSNNYRAKLPAICVFSPFLSLLSRLIMKRSSIFSLQSLHDKRHLWVTLFFVSRLCFVCIFFEWSVSSKLQIFGFTTCT